MSGDHSKYDDEIDIFAFFETLWNGKWKIIATIFFVPLIGIVYTVNKPNTFRVTTPIEHGSQSVFLTHTSLNNFLKEKKLLYDEKTNVNGYQFNSREVFKMFVSEFNDYEEMIDVLSKNDFIKESLKELEGIGRQRALIGLAKSFKLSPQINKNRQYLLEFEWHDASEGTNLFKKAIAQTILNIQSTSIKNVNKLAKAIEIQNTRKLESLNKQLETIVRTQTLEDSKRLQYLREQFSVAKQLGIKTNKLDADAFKENPLSKNIPYYLIGYETIEKEMAIIKNRSNNDRMVLSPKYIEIKNQIISIENDLSSSHLRSASELIELDNPQNWVEFDFSLADIVSLKKTLLYVLSSLMLGGIFGSIYVLISHSILMRKHNSV